MAKFKKDATYDEQGEKTHVGSRDGRRSVRIDDKDCAIDYHIETRQIVNPLNPYEICDSEEELARSLARMVSSIPRIPQKSTGCDEIDPSMPGSFPGGIERRHKSCDVNNPFK